MNGICLFAAYHLSLIMVNPLKLGKYLFTEDEKKTLEIKKEIHGSPIPITKKRQNRSSVSIIHFI